MNTFLNINSNKEITNHKITLNLFSICHLRFVLLLTLTFCNLNPASAFAQIQPDTTLAHSCLKLGEQFQADSEFDSAVVYLEKASSIFKKIAKQDDRKIFWERLIYSESLIADALFDLGNFAGSLKHAEPTLDLALEKLGEVNSLTAKAYLNVGNVFYVNNEYKSAAEFYRKALKIRMQLFGKIHESVAIAYNNLGNTFDDRGEPDSAMVYYQKTLDIRLKLLPESEPNLWVSYVNIGSVYYDRGDFDRALDFFSNSKERHLKHYGDKDRDAAILYNNLAAVHQVKGNFEQAIESYNKALSIFKTFFGERHPEIGLLFMNMGETYWQWRDYDQAKKYIIKAQSIYKNAFGETHIEVGFAYDYLGRFSNLNGQHDQAIAYHKKAAKVYAQSLNESHSYFAENNYYLGDAYAKIGAYETAHDYYSKAWEAYASIDESHPYLAAIRNQIGINNIQKKNYDGATKDFHEALTLNLQVFGENHDETAYTYLNLGDLAFKQNDLKKAIAYYQKSIVSFVPDFSDSSIYSTPNVSGLRYDVRLLDAFNAKANALRGLSASSLDSVMILQVALSTYNVAAKFIDITRSAFKGEGSKLFLSEKVHKIYDFAIQTALVLHALTEQNRFKEQAFQFAEKSRAAILNDALRESRARQFSSIPEELLNEEKDLRINLAFYETQIQKLKDSESKNDSLQLADFQNRYFDFKTQYDKLIEKLEQNYPEYYQLKYQTNTPSVADIQNNLAEETTLLEYFLGDSTLYIFTIAKDNFNVTSLPLNPNFSRIVTSFYRAIKKVDSQTFIQSAALIYETLIKPIEPLIASRKKLLIIPDGVLSYLPFEALLQRKPVSGRSVDFSQLDFLIKNYEILYHYSTALAFGGKQKAKTKDRRFIGFAPVFSNDVANGYILASNLENFKAGNLDEEVRSVTINGKWFSELPYSKDEVSSIAKIFRDNALQSQGYFHKAASEENFKQQVANARYLHIATHGILNEDRPKLSGLIFSQPQDSTETEDGILYAGETFNLNLNADLVVLSSCESGLGQLVKGEGLMALTRGFLYSGAENVMVSLWKVYDKHTSQLMVDFYKNVLSGKRYPQALREAKLKMLRDRKNAFPKKWSGFVLIGNELERMRSTNKN